MNQCKSVLEHRDKLWGKLSESEGNIVATRVGVIAREILGTGRAAETGKRCTDTPRKPAPRLLLQCPLPLITRCSLELEGIKEVLLAHHLAGARLPSASKGSDREVLVREFLSQVFPPQFRFGTGAIVDASKNMTGQLDIVIEFPFLPSLPAPGARDRLYLADSVAVVIEVKSNLTSQWPKIRASAAKVQSLKRDWRAHASLDTMGQYSLFDASKSRIPYLVVSFKGA